MKILIFIAVAFAAVNAVTVKSNDEKHVEIRNLGQNKCTWGPSYWCQNLTTAGGCHATKHCIQTDWIHRKLPPDHSSICQTCLDMVKQARDQLESNETQELIREVFEGSCALLHFKPVVVECDRIVDSFIPDLIETLSSRMDPQAVCSVAGLCNNAAYLEWKQLNEPEIAATGKPDMLANTCVGCHTVIGIMQDKFDRMSKNEVLQKFLMLCGKTSSLSDACSNIILTYFSNIYDHLRVHFNSEEVCLLSGECSAMFHHHDGIEVTSISKTGVLHVNTPKEDDMACDFCKQLVQHLRDILVANTTELEFKQVLEGLCKQTKSFADECTNLVEEYYPVIYNFLLTELNSGEVCGLAGICPRNQTDDLIPIRPLLPVETADTFESAGLARVPLTKNPTVQIISNSKNTPLEDFASPDEAQLPIELMVPSINQGLYSKQVCEFCEYFLHYVQQLLTSPATEDQIKKIIDEACQKLPNSINNTCVGFVETYEPALVALLVQEIDPSTICPLIKACPSSDTQDVDIFMEQSSGNDKCPLCLFAVTKLEEMVKNKKTRDEIKEALDSLCSKLSLSLKKECTEFVDNYTEQLVELIIADLNPQEVCVYLKLCTDKNPAPKLPTVKKVLSGDVDTNMIIDNTINGVVVNKKQERKVSNVECYFCKLVMNDLVKLINNDRMDVKTALENVCKNMPSSLDKTCYSFIEQYYDILLTILTTTMKPEIFCSYIQVCSMESIPEYRLGIKLDAPLEPPKSLGNSECILCKLVMKQIDEMIKQNEGEIETTVTNICKSMPQAIKDECDPFIKEYGDTIIQFLIAALEPADFCSYIKICPSDDVSFKNEILDCVVCKAAVHIMKKIIDNPHSNHEVKHVLEKTCRALPYRERNKCIRIMDKYGMEIFKLIVTHTSLICHEIKVCASEPAVPKISGLTEKKHTPPHFKIRPVLYKPVY